MEYKKYNIKNVDVYFIKTDKFKTIKMDVLFLNDYDVKDFTKHKLLQNYLCRSTNNFKTEIKLQREILSLYDLGYGISNNYLNVNIKSFNLNFLNEKYTEKGMNEKSIDFFFDLIYNPNKNNNSFDEENFNLSKKVLESMYKRQLEDSNYQAERNSISLITSDLPIKYDSTGNFEDLSKITPKSLYNFYKKIIKESDVKVFVIGDFSDEEMIKILDKNLKENKNKDKYIPKGFKITKKTDNPVEKIENANYNQSIFIMIYKILNITEREKNYVLPILNEILGGSNSKLFKNVREKNSLAYYIYSTRIGFQSTLIIESGISKENFEKVKEIVIGQIDEIKNKNITNKELNSAKEKIKSNVLKIDDNQGRILNDYESEIIYKLKNSKEFIKQIESVTKEEVASLSNKLNLDVTYMLKGVNE